MDDAAIHRGSEKVFNLAVCLLDHSGSPRAFSPRDDKVERVVYPWSLTTRFLSLRGGRKSDAAIHRVLEDADGLSLR